MRQRHPPAGNLFLLCLNCDRGEWRRTGQGEITPPCRHCAGPTVQRHPLTLALTAEERGLLKTIAEWNRLKTEAAAAHALRQEFRRSAAARAGKGKPIPQWAAEWLQTNPDKPL